MNISYTTTTQLSSLLQKVQKASDDWRSSSLAMRHRLNYTIANNLDAKRSSLIKLAHQESNLSIPRLETEFDRTLHQLRSYADYAKTGEWLQARKSNEGKSLFKTQIALGPVVVFGSSNFPFAYSTAGGDTASALLAGCAVVVKAHSAHYRTSEAVAKLIQKSLKELGLPKSIFTHLHIKDYAVTEKLIKHPVIKAVAFTGSYTGGMQMYKWAQERIDPIPVFAEMGSVNPVFYLPKQLEAKTSYLAQNIFDSMMHSVGQFCTNPGILVGLETKAWRIFQQLLSEKVRYATPEKMLHSGVYENFIDNRKRALKQSGVQLLATSETKAKELESIPTLTSVSAEKFLSNDILKEEVFGTYTMMVSCKNKKQMQAVAAALQGQLTCTIIGTITELKKEKELIATLSSKAGRIVFNDVPTGVEVSLAQNHGGPFPATTDSRFTAVGGDAIRRFTRPLVFQNAPKALLTSVRK